MLVTKPSQHYTLADHQKLLQDHPVLLYMKGTPDEPLCGFSKQVVDILHQGKVSFAAVNVLDPDIRSELKQISGWPTFPQLYIQGELIGGCDIIADLYATGELQKQLASE